MTKLTAREKGLFIPLMIGMVLMAACQLWISTETANILNMVADQSHTASIQQMMQVRDRIRLVNSLYTAISVVTVAVLLVLLFTADRNPNTALMLKLFLVMPALYYLIGGGLVLFGEQDVLGLIMLFFGFMLIIPNQLLLRERLAGFAYVIGVYVAALCWVLLVNLKLQAHSPDSILRMLGTLVAFVSTLSVAATVSFCSAYRQEVQEGPGRNIARGYTIAVSLLLTLLLAAYAGIQLPRYMKARGRAARTQKFMDGVGNDYDPGKAGPRQ